MSADGVPPGCDAVAAAPARLDARPRVVLRTEVASGRPADGVYRFALHRDGATERRVLDGHALRTTPAWGRALSRPTKPPQAALRPTGARLLERLDFDYPPLPPGGSDTGDPR